MGNKEAKKISTDLTEKQIAMLKTNTNFTDREIREWHEGFFRDYPSGRLDKKKFVEIYKEFYPTGKADTYCKYAFQTFDSNKDGSIDFDEFLLTIAVSSQGSLDERLAVAFDLYDFSNDGQIDQKELATLIVAMYDLVDDDVRKGDRDPKKRAAAIIAKLDTNGDKKLSKEEFISACKSDSVIRQILAPSVQM